MPKTQDELLVQRVLWLQAKHPLASMVPLDLSMRGSSRYRDFTLARRKDSHLKLYDYFDEDYLNRDSDCEEADLALSGNTRTPSKLGYVFRQPLPWVTQLLLELDSDPPVGLKENMVFGDEEYNPPRWDLAPRPMPEHQLPLRW